MPDGSVILTEIRNRRCSRVTADGKVTRVLRQWRRAERARGRAGRRALSAATTAAAATSRASRWGRGRIPTTRAARSSGSIRRPARPSCSTPSATAIGFPRPTTWCSTRRAASTSPISASATPAIATMAASTTPGPTARRSSCLVYPFLSPNGCGLSPDGKVLYVADTVSARLYAYDIEAPGVLAQAPRPISPIAAASSAAPAGPRRLRQPGRAGQRQHLRGDAHHRQDHRVRAATARSCAR